MRDAFTKEFKVKGRTCRIREFGSGGPVFLWAYHAFSDGPEGAVFEDFCGRLSAAFPEKSFVLAAFSVEDWDAELSPWEAPQAFGSVPFAGKGPETLSWLEKEFVPFLREHFPESALFPMGYSLAGLFSLWALYESDLFSGCICCSGSLWIDGWEEYSRTHRVKRESSVYISLGGREEKTGNPFMARVGERTRKQEILLKEDPLVTRSILFWNKGGHFADHLARLLKGMEWMLPEQDTDGFPGA